MSNYRLFFIADKNKSSLIERISNILVQLKNNTDKELSYFLPELPQKLDIRLLLLVTDLKSLEEKLDKTVNFLTSSRPLKFSSKDKIFITDNSLEPGKTVFLFPGFGSEFPEMLSGISSQFKIVSNWMTILDELLNKRTEYNVSIKQDEWLESQLKNKNYGVAEGGPIGSIASLAFKDVLQALNIKCDAMIGHSNGENAALISSGILNYKSKENFLKILQLLSEFPQPKNKDGVYLAVNNFSKENLDKLLECYPSDVFLAMNNCPGQQVLYTKLRVLESVLKFIKKEYGLAFEITTDHPYHTECFEDSLKYFKPVYNQFNVSKGYVPVYSCINATFFPEDEEGIRDLAMRQWVEPVDFQKTIKTAYEQGARTFIEVGPNNRLSGFVTNSLKGKNFLMVNCSKEGISALDSIIEMCAKLWVNNHDVDLSYFTQNIKSSSIKNKVEEDSRLTSREKIFEAHQELMQKFLKVNDVVTKSFLSTLNVESKAINKTPLIREIDQLLLKGNYKKTKTGLEYFGTLDLAKHKLIKDHSMGGELPVVPFTLSLELLAEIATQLIEEKNAYITVFDSNGNKWFDFEGSSIDLKIIANWEPNDANEKIVAIEVYDITDESDSKIPAFQGKVKSILSEKNESKIELGDKRNPATISVGDFYKDHLFHGTCFKSIAEINYWNNKGVEAIFKMPDLSNAIEGISSPEFTIPGPMLDSTGQLMAYWLFELGMYDYAIFPFHLGSFHQYRKFPTSGSSIKCKAKIKKESSVITGDFEFIEADGSLIGRLSDFRLRLFIHEWIPPLLMNRMDDANPRTLTADFLNEGGGIWKKILAKLTLKDKAYADWLKSSNKNQIQYLLEQKTSVLS